MHFSHIVAFATLAMTAAAAPSPALEARTTQPECSACGMKNVCCNGLLNCVLSAFGTNCDGSAYCCSTTQNSGSVNIALLNCVAV